ncbi:hypothetical protein EN836_27950 [Mesorhizobium sp. M1C.F.Ca.ET.193.01.1.1]|uniref:hypothetical protein n=1 Tax=unclassified Mesorhizobium TaxID=325217 RepID=UPI000FD42B61|nr:MULTISPECIES: hypothetical protein [unclassified Mesorhizobium]TGS93428.1 hypothetical protein EN820_48610 [bacterium M00.F.Ca.ET.177.01.1.1]RWA62384.1 MAG: hypothetical protein EOQ28_31230 [Mesorhizobium sp.]RWB94669.1 MAG: hypothetical protein EOQ57_31365 [Mesorhizobium sp.]RWG78383.1 MAG: hypothetical protein EOQ69_26580 [Mesorhizobium sp.]RWG83369.1 MAG: hypothetical protein EOQ70_21345 [Mesorhizobium sp.]
MRLPTYISSEDLDMLAAALNDHCQAWRIPVGAEREEVARLIMVLFDSGIDDPDDMKAALIAARRIHA